METSRSASTQNKEPIPHYGLYHEWGHADDWGKKLESLPAITRREIDLHLDLTNMAFRPKVDSTRVSKPAIRGAHFKAERYLDADSIFTRSDEQIFFTVGQNALLVRRTVFGN